MQEDGTIYALTGGDAPRYGGGSLATLPMENLLADAEIPGIDDEFFVIIPDPEHHRCFVPYLLLFLIRDTRWMIFVKKYTIVRKNICIRLILLHFRNVLSSILKQTESDYLKIL